MKLGDKAIENRINKIKALENEKKNIDDEIEAIKNEIKQEMTNRGVDECRTANFIVRFKEIISNNFDSKKFKADMPELYESYVIVRKSMRFTIV